MEKQIFDTLKRIIAYKTVEAESRPGMPFGEQNFACLTDVLKMCESFGMKTVNLDGYCGYAETGDGELVGILCHLDVVPTGDNWNTDPFEAVIKDGYIYGRGVVDDKGPAVLNIYAVKELIESGLKPKRRIRLIFGCNEESGMKCMEYYKSHSEIPSLAYAPDAEFPLIVTEKGIADVVAYLSKPVGLSYIKGGQRRNIVPDLCEAKIEKKRVVDITKAKACLIREDDDFYILSAKGKAAHASTPKLGENAIVKVLEDLYAVTRDSVYKEIADKCVTDGSGIGLKVEDFSGAFTVNLGKIETENEKLKLNIDMRCPVTMCEDKVKAGANAFSVENDVTFSPPLNADENSYLVKTLLGVYGDVTKNDKKPLRIGGGTYARALPCPAVAFGPVETDEICNVHDANERISVESFEKAYEIYKTAIKRLCF